MITRAYLLATNEIFSVEPQLLDMSWGTLPMGPTAHISRSIANVSSLCTVSDLSFDPIRVRVLYVEESQLGGFLFHSIFPIYSFNQANIALYT